MSNFFDYPRMHYEEWLTATGVSPVHARSLFRNAYRSHRKNPWNHPDFPESLLEKVGDRFQAFELESAEEQRSKYDSSVKFLFKLQDGQMIESVLMPESGRLTVCLSSQVGCAQGCVFCHTGRMGLIRQLTPGEIVAQVVTINRWISKTTDWNPPLRRPRQNQITNVVFMGMGEPLDNIDGIIPAIDILTDPYGLSIGPRRISVSTAGHLPGLESLMKRAPKVSFALSVHNGNDSLRSKIMPINQKWPIEQVIESIERFQKTQGSKRSCLIQYTLIAGVNDQEKDAIALAKLLSPIKSKVNLIPLNPIKKMRLRSSSSYAIAKFRDVLHSKDIRTMVRYSKGQDIDAACGQLVVERPSEHPAELALSR